MLGCSRSTIAALIEAGFVTPARGPRNEYRFTFQDVVLLRTAQQLRAAEIPARRVLRALRQLKDRLPQSLPLSGLRITAVGNDIAVREGSAAWAAESGQGLLDFEVGGQAGEVAFLDRGAVAVADPAAAADEAVRQGEQREPDDAEAAEQAYRRALALVPGHLGASLNLGVLLAGRGRLAEALAVYDAALALSPTQALLHYNRAVALEDDGRPFEALAAYAACLAQAPEFADAHFNAARLHESLGQLQSALRHYSAYRRLQP